MDMTRFASGPAAAVRAMPCFGFRKLFIFTGTGLAQPKRKTTSMTRPSTSMCFIGLRERRPARFAVSSPSIYAVMPWAHSWSVMQISAGSTLRSSCTGTDQSSPRRTEAKSFI